ncbi:HNH endonuclease [Deinococcus ruber]|uniref:HNH endonuclease n=1 Tax=Deinococcus ruber TaxID=1848197 RepID=UPI001E2FF33F|nr:HNH endonuclease [Deinococcus ruber]
MFDAAWLEKVMQFSSAYSIKIALVIGRCEAEGRTATYGAVYDAFHLDGRTFEANVEKLIQAGLIQKHGKGYVTGKGYTTPHSVFETRQSIPRALRQAVFDRDAQACIYCGATENLSLDHVVPWSRGGADTFENLVTACRSCNSSKNARTPVEWQGTAMN